MANTRLGSELPEGFVLESNAGKQQVGSQSSIPEGFVLESTPQQEPQNKNVDFFEALGAKITPEMEKQFPYLSAVGKTAQDFVSIPVNFFNEMLLNAPRSILNKKFGIDLPEAESTPAKVGSAAAGVAGAFKNPVLKALGVGRAGTGITGAAAQGGVVGLTRFPTEDPLGLEERAKQGIGGAVTGGAFGATGKALSVANKAPKSSRALAQRIVNSLIKPSEKQLSYGRNPALQIAKEGIVAGDLNTLATKISSRLRKVGSNINRVLEDADSRGKTVDLSKTINIIDDAIKSEQRFGRVNQRFITEFQKLKDDLLDRPINTLRPQEAFQIKKDIGNLTRFTGNESDDKVFNSLLKKIYGETKKQINKLDPKSLVRENERYANLLSARAAAQKRFNALQKTNLANPLNFTTVGTGVLGTAIGGPAVGIAAGAATRLTGNALKSPKILTSVAKSLIKLNPSDRNQFYKANADNLENIRSVFLKLGTTSGAKVVDLIDLET